METPVTDKPESEPGGGTRLKTILKRAGLALLVVLLLALGGGGGYVLGRNSGEDLDAARAEGATAGLSRGTATAGDAYAEGEARGRRVTYGPAFRDSYRAAYREAFKDSKLDVPSAEQIAVPVP
jgi:hypothetical protein